MLVQIDQRALATFVLDTLDFHPDYEDDAGAFTFQDARIYWERKKTMFVLHVGAERIRLPRC